LGEAEKPNAAEKAKANSKRGTRVFSAVAARGHPLQIQRIPSMLAEEASLHAPLGGRGRYVNIPTRSAAALHP